MPPEHSEGYRQVCALLDLAWKNCARDIIAVVHMYIGMILFICAFATFLLLNVAQYQSFVTIPDINIAGTQLSVVIMSMMISFVNAFATITFLAIVICLFEYALSFTIVCYHYDNRAWVTPKLFWNVIDAINSHFQSKRDENAKSDRKHRVYLDNETLKIRNGNTESKIE
jgi:hypothetical protein